ncbi:hypothetical protein CK203_052458 [Vitis vinifera]|uniref:Uncharacterized protein n=1 Tax=Vitis vinifera TaxID=29760 RepID=A0A438HCF4_VITVI|nr:hypothetical protein CK203_052458 [Vitis vinifera]
MSHILLFGVWYGGSVTSWIEMGSLRQTMFVPTKGRWHMLLRSGSSPTTTDRELTLEGAAWLMDLNGNQFSELTNVDQLKRYYV